MTGFRHRGRNAFGWSRRTGRLGLHGLLAVMALALILTSDIFGCERCAMAADPLALDSKAQLGRLLFHDPSLSSPPGQACASCHAPHAGFSDPDPRAPTSKGATPTLFGKRNAPSAAYAKFSPAFHFDAEEKHYVGGQFVDGRASSLELQAIQPFFDPLEMANAGPADLISKLRAAAYAPMFSAAFGPGVLQNQQRALISVGEALAAFERSAVFSPFSSKFDAWRRGEVALSAQELRGLDIFNSPQKGNCAACHPSEPSKDGTPALFTDFTYDNLGVPRNPANSFYTMHPTHNPAGRDFVDLGLGARPDLPTDPGDEQGKFKVPTMRNVAVTAPYMHNGYFADLRSVLQFYNDRDVRPRCKNAKWTSLPDAQKQICWPEPEVARNVNAEELGKLGLSDAELDDLLAFLHTLTDGFSKTGSARGR
jgi:cytochrome c peroxidase